MSGLSNLLLAGAMAVSPDLFIENTFIAGYQELYQTTGFNRLRGNLTLEHEQYTELFARLIIDNKTLYTTTPSNLQNKTTIYRAYLQYRGMTHFWSFGKQRIPLGVGRIWNPIDVFNPVNIEQIEPDERTGSNSIRYEYALGKLSNIDITIARNKGVVRLKGYLEYAGADIAIVGGRDDNSGIDLIGWELEGQLLESGIALRSEGGRFHNRTTGEHYFKYIIGAEYGFPNSLSILAEYKYSGNTHNDYLGGQVSYQPGMLWLCYLLIVVNEDDHSGFIAPSVEYSLGDDMTLSGGAFIYYGNGNSEFGHVPDRYFLRWFIHF